MGMAAEPITEDFRWISSLVEECRLCPGSRGGSCGRPVENVVNKREKTILYPPVDLEPCSDV